MKYWIIVDDIERGPFTLDEIASQTLMHDTPVWHEGLADWVTASEVEALVPYITAPSVPEDYVVPVAPVIEPLRADLQPAPVPPVPVQDVEAAPQPAAPVVSPATPAAVMYVPVGEIPAGYMAIAPTGEPKCPPTYLVGAILATVLCFLPLGVCAIICAVKVKGHYRAARYDKAYRMSERAALFIILAIVAMLIWMPFSVVFSMF